MRALCVVMSDVLADEFSQVLLTQRDDAVEALLFDRADEALRVSQKKAPRLRGAFRSLTWCD